MMDNKPIKYVFLLKRVMLRIVSLNHKAQCNW